jgi:hypothetical protein
MRCEDFVIQLNARADGELAAEEAAALEVHLATCPECRAEADAVEAITIELRRAFTPRRDDAALLAESTIAAIRALPVSSTPASASPTAAHRIQWAQLLIGLAAGFLLAIALFQPWQRGGFGFSVPPGEPIAHLAVSSAPVEVWPAFQRADEAVKRNQCATGEPIGRNSYVRTGADDRCEIALTSGNSLRLDCNTEVKLLEANVVEINRGRVASATRHDGKELQIKVYSCPVDFEKSAQWAVECQPERARLIVVDGEAHVQSDNQSIAVGRGKQVWISQGKVEKAPEWCDTTLETAWVNSVLALRGSEHPELVERVNQLLVNVGSAKLSLLYEDELRRLGDAGVPPLVAYLNATREKSVAAERTTAARIVADVAESRWIGDLIALLTDTNADVRFHAARGLERLTGRNQGCPPATWKTGSWFTCESPHKLWLDWWAANRNRYPLARHDIPAPTTPPF